MVRYIFPVRDSCVVPMVSRIKRLPDRLIHPVVSMVNLPKLSMDLKNFLKPH